MCFFVSFPFSTFLPEFAIPRVPLRADCSPLVSKQLFGESDRLELLPNISFFGLAVFFPYVRVPVWPMTFPQLADATIGSPAFLKYCLYDTTGKAFFFGRPATSDEEWGSSR